MANAELDVGMQFETIEEGRLTIETWLLRNGWSSKVSRSNQRRTSHKCISKDCPFTANITASEKEVRLTKLIYHTCPSYTHDKWRGHNRVAILANDSTNLSLFINDPKARPEQVRRQKLRLHENVISKHTAWKLREKARFQQFGNEEKSFQKIPSLLLAMQQGQEVQRRGITHRYYKYKLEMTDGQFSRY